MVQMKHVLFCLLTITCACASPLKANAKFTAVDTFGSSRISESLILSKYGSKLDALSDIPETDPDEFVRFRHELEDEIKNDLDLAYAGIAIITYFAPLSGRYATVDVVEHKDAKARMPFLAEPKGKYQDPDGVIALWDEYQKLSLSLLKAGKLEYPKGCPAWHCTLGFEHPQLAPYLERFNSLAVKNESALAKILKDDSRPNYRANAAFLFAHTKDGNKLVKYVSEMIFDSSDLVRNNTIRVLSEVAHSHPSVPIDIKIIIRALQFPTTTDRNKAGFVLANLSEKEADKEIILKSVGWTCLDMLKLHQINNRQPAHMILKNVSGEKFSEDDFASWEAWLVSKIGPRK
jgi:hypothetical protein